MNIKTKLTLLIIPIIFTSLSFTSEEHKESEDKSKCQYVTAKAVDENIIQALQHYVINKYLIGDNLETSPEFIKSLTLTLNYENIARTKITPDNKYLIVAERDAIHNGLVHIIETATTKEIANFEFDIHDPHPSISILTSKESKNILIADNDKFAIFNTDTKTLKRNMGDNNYFAHYRARFSKNCKFAYIPATLETKLTFFNLETSNESKIEGLFARNEIFNTNYNCFIFNDNNNLKVLDLKNDREYTIENYQYDTRCNIVFISENNRYLFAKKYTNSEPGNSSKAIDIIDLETQEFIFSTQMQFNFNYTNNRLCLFMSSDYTKHLYDLQTRQQISLPTDIYYIYPIKNSERHLLYTKRNDTQGYILHYYGNETLYHSIINGFDINKCTHNCIGEPPSLIENNCINEKYLIINQKKDPSDFLPCVVIYDIEQNAPLYNDSNTSNKYHLKDNSVITNTNNTVNIFDFNLHEEITSLTLQNCDIKDVLLSNDNKYIFILTDNTLKIYESDLKKEILELQNVLWCSQNNNYLIIHMRDNTQMIFDAEKQKVINPYKDTFEPTSQDYIDTVNHKFITTVNNKTKLALHKFDKSILHKCNPYQINFIIYLYHKHKQLVESGDQYKCIYLNARFTKLFKTLPKYVQKCLLSNYNLVSESLIKLNAIEENLEKYSDLV